MVYFPASHIRKGRRIIIFRRTRFILCGGILTAALLLFLEQGCAIDGGSGYEAVTALHGKPQVVSISIEPPIATPSPVPSPKPVSVSITLITPSPTPLPTPFSLFWVSDTQVYAYKYPQVFNKVFSFMVNAKEGYNALGVLQTGDIVDNRHLERHWTNAQNAIGLLKGSLPFWCVAGNHDVGADTADYEKYLSCGFCSVTDEEKLFRNGECWYDTFSAGGTDFLLLGIGWELDADYVEWAEGVLQRNKDKTVILLTHSFLTDDGNLTGNGKKLEGNLISVYSNIRLVLCGHNDGSVRWSKTYADGRTVRALLYNFQDDKKYGLGYLRVLTFDPQDRSIAVITYSPWFDDFNYYRDTEKDEFVLTDAF